MNLDNLAWRRQVVAADGDRVRHILASSGFFHDHEIEVAVELVDEHLAKGETASGYSFLFADSPTGETLGFTCYGPIACTVGSFDLYWIAVDQACRGQGLGEGLLKQSERHIQAQGGRRIYIETSGRPLYAPTQKFYAKCGYRLEARLEDYYDVGDAKLIFVRAC